jgi:5,10-methylenetetrahydrofolate reductase
MTTTYRTAGHAIAHEGGRAVAVDPALGSTAHYWKGRRIAARSARMTRRGAENALSGSEPTDRVGAIIRGELQGELTMVEIACNQCGRAGESSLVQLADAHPVNHFVALRGPEENGFWS